MRKLGDSKNNFNKVYVIAVSWSQLSLPIRTVLSSSYRKWDRLGFRTLCSRAAVPTPEHSSPHTLLRLLLLLSHCSRVRLLVTPWTAAHRLLRPWGFPGKSSGVGCHCLLCLLKQQNTKKRMARRVTARMCSWADSGQKTQGGQKTQQPFWSAWSKSRVPCKPPAHNTI